MKGVLCKNINGWNVEYTSTNIKNVIPLCPSEIYSLGHINPELKSYNDGDEIEFDFVDSWVDLHIIRFAKIILQKI